MNKLACDGVNEPAERQQRGSVLSLQPTNKRLHRQSTISCDGNFATVSTGESAGRRKTAKASTGNLTAAADQEFEALDETQEAAAAAAKVEPSAEWPAKWGSQRSKNGSLASPVSRAESISRNSLSVPSTPMQHQTFTFDVFNGNDNNYT